MTFTYKCVGCSRSTTSPRETAGSCPFCGCDEREFISRQEETSSNAKFGYLSATSHRETKPLKQKKRAV